MGLGEVAEGEEATQEPGSNIIFLLLITELKLREAK